MTASHSAQSSSFSFASRTRRLDVEVDLDHRRARCSSTPLRLDQPELALARLELELHVADEHRARAVEHARLACRTRARTAGMKSAAGSSKRIVIAAAPARDRSRSPARARSRRAKSVFSENCGPISCRPTGSPSREAARHVQPGQARHARRDREQVVQVHRERVRPSSRRARTRRVGDVGVDEHVEALERLRVLADQHRAHLLRLAVVRVVVARPRARTSRP